MLVNYRAPAVLPNGEKPYTRLRGPSHHQVRDPAAQRTRSPRSIPRYSRTRSSSSASRPRAWSTSSRLRSTRGPGADARRPDARERRRQHPLEPVHPSGGRPAGSVAATLAGAIARRPAGRFSPVQRRRAGGAGRDGGWVAYAVSAFKGGLWLNMVEPLAAMGLALFSGTAYQYFVEGREKRKVKTAVRPLRVEGRLRSAAGAPGSRRARRQAPRHDRAVLGYPRLHQRSPRRGSRRSSSRS